MIPIEKLPLLRSNKPKTSGAIIKSYATVVHAYAIRVSMRAIQESNQKELGGQSSDQRSRGCGWGMRGAL